MDKYGLHAGGWHGDMSETDWDTRVAAAKILGADYIGSGGEPAPGIGSYANTLATAAALNRLGKRSVEAGLGPAYFHNHQREFTTRYMHNGVLTTAFDILLAESDVRYSAAEIDVFWSSDAFQDITGTQTAALINQWPTRVQLLHIKDGINVDEPGERLPARRRYRRARLPADLRRGDEQGPLLPPGAGWRHDDGRRHQLHEPEGPGHGLGRDPAGPPAGVRVGPRRRACRRACRSRSRTRATSR